VIYTQFLPDGKKSTAEDKIVLKWNWLWLAQDKIQLSERLILFDQTNNNQLFKKTVYNGFRMNQMVTLPTFRLT